MAPVNRLTVMTAEEYHGDPCEQPSLSSSIAHELIARSPRHAYLAHPRLGGIGKPPTKASAGGLLIHALLLDAGAGIVEVEAEDFRSKAAREIRDAAHAAGQIPVLSGDLLHAVAAADELRQRIGDFGITLDGLSEIVALWSETADDGTVVQCRGRLDHWAAPTILDLKICRSAHPTAIARHMIEYGCEIQAAAYRSGIAKLQPELAGRVDFVFLFCELEPAPMVTPIRPAGTMRELGEQRWRRAVNLWARCTVTNDWPGYTSGIIDIDAPPWALQQEFDAAIAADDAREAG